MNRNSTKSNNHVLNENLRQQKESFDQHKIQSQQWFRLRLIMGYIAVFLLPSIFILSAAIIFNYEKFSETVVASATATLFVDAVGIVYSIWKILLNAKFATKLVPLTEPQSKGAINNSDQPKKKIENKNTKSNDESEEFKILEARYGTKGKSVDVKDILQENIAGGRLEMYVDNIPLGGDPAPLVHKVLEVVYSVSGEIRTILVHEGNLISIP